MTTIATGIFVAFFAAFANINEVIELTNIGTLFAFVIVALGVMVLRVREPERHRPFRTPAIWVVAPAAVLSCGFLMFQLPRVTWERFGIWLALGLLIYALYGYRRSPGAQSAIRLASVAQGRCLGQVPGLWMSLTGTALAHSFSIIYSAAPAAWLMPRVWLLLLLVFSLRPAPAEASTRADGDIAMLGVPTHESTREALPEAGFQLRRALTCATLEMKSREGGAGGPARRGELPLLAPGAPSSVADPRPGVDVCAPLCEHLPYHATAPPLPR